MSAVAASSEGLDALIDRRLVVTDAGRERSNVPAAGARALAALPPDARRALHAAAAELSADPTARTWHAAQAGHAVSAEALTAAAGAWLEAGLTDRALALLDCEALPLPETTRACLRADAHLARGETATARRILAERLGVTADPEVVEA